MCFLAALAKLYNKFILDGQKLSGFAQRSYDASVVYDIIQFLNTGKDIYGYLSGICEFLDVNGYANATNVNGLKQIIKDIESGIKNNGGEFKFSDFVRTLQCVAPITSSKEFDKCILEFLQSDAMKDKPFNRNDLSKLLIAKSYILNHAYHKNNEHKIGGNNIGDKAMEHAKNSVDIKNINFGKDLAEEISKRLRESKVDKLNIAEYAAIASSSYYTDDQSKLFDDFKPYISFDVAEVLVLSEMDINIPDDKKKDLVQKIIDFMDEKAKEDGKYIISLVAAIEILYGLNLKELDKKSGLSEEQRLALLSHIDHIPEEAYSNAEYIIALKNGLISLVKILKISSEEEQKAILGKIKNNSLFASDINKYIEAVGPESITDDVKNILLDKYLCFSDLSDCAGLKELDLKGDQIDTWLKKIKENEPYYPFSLHVLINALPNASEEQKLMLLDFEEKHEIKNDELKYKSDISEAIKCAEAFKFKEKQSKITFLNALDKFIYYGKDVLGAEEILALAKALGLNFAKDKDNDLKNELLKTIARYIKDSSDKESDEKEFTKYQLDAGEAYKISKALNLNEDQKKYLCSSQAEAGGHTIINFEKQPKELFKAGEIEKEFSSYLKNSGLKANIKSTAETKLKDEIKCIHRFANKYRGGKIEAEDVKRILSVVEDKKQAKEVFGMLMRDKKDKKVKAFEYINDVVNLLDNNPEIKKIINSDDDQKKIFSEAVLKSEVNKYSVPKLARIIGMEFINKNKDIYDGIKKLNGDQEIKIPVDIILSCNDGNPVKNNDKVKIRAAIKINEEDAEPKGKIKFNLFSIGMENQTVDLKKDATGEYYAEVDYNVSSEVDGYISAEYMPTEDEYYTNGECGLLNITTGEKKLDTKIEFDKPEAKGEKESKTKLGDTLNGRIYLSGIVEDLGMPDGKLEIYDSEYEFVEYEHPKTEISLAENNIKTDGDRYYVDFKYQASGLSYVKAKFVPENKNTKYANGKNDAKKLETQKRDLNIELVLNGNDGKDGAVKTKLGQKNKFRLYLNGYDERFAFEEKQFYFDIKDVNGDTICNKLLYEDDIKNIKKEGDKYYIEVEKEVNPEATGIYAECSYYGQYYSIKQAEKINIKQEELELKITKITSSEGNKIKFGTKTKLRAYLDGIAEEIKKPQGNVVFNLPDGTKSMASINYDQGYYAEIEYQPNQIVSWGDAKNITAEYFSIKGDFYKECEYKNEKASLILEVVEQQQKENHEQDANKSKLIITQANYLDQKIKTGDKIRFDIKVLEGQKDLGLPKGLLEIKIDGTKQYVNIQRDNNTNKYYAELVFNSNFVYEFSKKMTGKIKYIQANQDSYEGRADDLNIEMEKSREEEEKENKNKDKSKKKLNIGIMYIGSRVKIGLENTIGMYIDGIENNKIPKGKLKLTVYDGNTVLKEYNNIDFASLENGILFIELNEKIKFDKIGQFVAKAEYIPIENDEYENGSNEEKLITVEEQEKTEDQKDPKVTLDDILKGDKNKNEGTKDTNNKKKIDWFSLYCGGCEYKSYGQWNIDSGKKAKFTVEIQIDKDLPKPNGSLQIMLGKNGENGIFDAKIREVDGEYIKYIAETDFEPQVEFTGDYSSVCADVSVRYIPMDDKDIYDFGIVKPLGENKYKIFVNKPEKIKDDKEGDEKHEEKKKDIKKDANRLKKDLKDVKNLINNGALEGLDKGIKDDIDKIIKDIDANGLGESDAKEELRNKLVEITKKRENIRGADALKLKTVIAELTFAEQVIHDLEDLMNTGILYEEQRNKLEGILAYIKITGFDLETTKKLVGTLCIARTETNDDSTKKKINNLTDCLSVFREYLSAKNWLVIGFGILSTGTAAFFAAGTFGVGPAALLFITKASFICISTGSGCIGILMVTLGIKIKDSKTEFRVPRSRTGPVLKKKERQD